MHDDTACACLRNLPWMLHQVRGIVLNCIRYGDTSVITRMYTDKFGVQSYIINGVRSSKSKNRQAMMQPLSLLNMVVYHREEKNLQRVREMAFDYVFHEVPFNVRSSSIAMFITEVLNKTLREETANPEIFLFLVGAIHDLDAPSVAPDFHLRFLARLSRLLGFAPDTDALRGGMLFDLAEGSFVSEEPGHYHVISPEDADAFTNLFQDTAPGTVLRREQRTRMLDSLLTYYRLHVEGFGQLRSHRILQTVLN